MIESHNQSLEGQATLGQLPVLEGKAMLSGLRARRDTRGQKEEGIRRAREFSSQTLLRQSVQSKAPRAMTQAAMTTTSLVVKTNGGRACERLMKN